MRKLFAGVVALSCGLGCERPSVKDFDATLAIDNISIVDVETGEIRIGQTILIKDARIGDIIPSGSFAAPNNLTVIDGAGKFAVPGLWDMHVHLPNDEEPVAWDIDAPDNTDPNGRQTYVPVWVAFGVTGAREMSGGAWSVRMRDRIEAGELDGPHLVIGSPILDGPYPIFPGNGVLAIASPEEARSAVKRLHDEGYDFLKPYNFLSPESYRAIIETAKALEMDVAGELPLSVSAWDAANLGQRSIEHMTGLETACSSKEDELRANYAAGVAAIAANPELKNQVEIWNRAEWEPVATIDSEKCERLFRHLADKEVWVTPTLAIQQRISYPEVSNEKDGAYLKYISKWDADVEGAIEQFDPERRLKPTYDHRFDVVDDLARAGVGILAGSDLQGGFWLHDELQIFVEAGLSPLEALQTATINPAKYVHRENELGAVAPGYFADIVLLNANPLQDIRNTRDIDAVILKGRRYDRAALDRMLEQTEKDARAWEASD